MDAFDRECEAFEREVHRFRGRIQMRQLAPEGSRQDILYTVTNGEMNIVVGLQDGQSGEALARTVLIALGLFADATAYAHEDLSLVNARAIGDV
ncbi:MAG: hypothetical protein U0990_04195 [Candidatus Nanopelagicales bacterium]|nr:hypothetical protein [Candidatus Nanopelagicales bacterium]